MKNSYLARLFRKILRRDIAPEDSAVARSINEGARAINDPPAGDDKSSYTRMKAVPHDAVRQEKLDKLRQSSRNSVQPSSKDVWFAPEVSYQNLEPPRRKMVRQTNASLTSTRLQALARKLEGPDEHEELT